MNRWIFLAAGVSLAMGCGSSTAPSDAATDTGGSEAGAGDVATNNDGATGSTDAGSTGNDGGTDASSGNDAADDSSTGATDAGSADSGNPDSGAMDAGPGNTLEGIWRLVQWQITSAQGTLTFTDTDTLVPGTTFQARGNGYLVISADRLALNVGLLINDHFAIDPTKAPGAAFPVFALTAPGSLTGDTFQINSTTAISWTRNGDGTITEVDTSTPGQSSRFTWARLPTPQGAPDFANATGLAVRLNDPNTADGGTPGPTPITRPRAALVWDVPNSSAVVMTNDSALSFVGTNNAYALFDAGTAEAPAQAVGNVGSVQLSLAYVIVYEDTNNNMAYDAPVGGGSGDTLRGFSPVAIAFTVGTPDATFLASRFRDLYSGWQYVNLHQDLYANVLVGAEPFDPTNPVAPDISVQPTAINFGIPDLL